MQMYRKVVSLLLLLGTYITASAAGYHLKGQVTDSLHVGLAGCSVSLLDPQDSTLSAFSITNQQGIYQFTAVKEGSYLLQVALMGYYTYYRPVVVNQQSPTDWGKLILWSNDIGEVLDEVIVSGEKIPVRIKGDTLEYNAGSFKVKPDAVVEDLLRKLPGVKVDQNGNITSMGKPIQQIMVNGKAFFGDDPKIATKNLPADAVEKVQAFEKKSDAALFSGMDDGTREQTLNLVLKEGKQTGYFGDVKAGIGLPDHYETALKAYKFRPQSQLAAMGMLNNINKFGFSFEDYFNFNGGLKSLMEGGTELRIDPNEIPIDIGQPVTGKVNSGAAALNYMLEPDKHNRFTLNYMGNGMRKLLDQRSTSRNYIPGGSFVTSDQEQSQSDNMVNRASVKWRQQLDSARFMTLNLYGLYGYNQQENHSFAENYNNSILENQLDNNGRNKGNKKELGTDFALIHKRNGQWPVRKISAQASYQHQLRNDSWHNRTIYADPVREEWDRQYRRYTGIQTGASITLSTVRALGKGHYLEPTLTAALMHTRATRQQGPLDHPELWTDSLSPELVRKVSHLTYGLTWRHNQKTSRWHLSLQRQDLWLKPILNGQKEYERHDAYLLPQAFWEKDLSKATRLSLSYNTSVAAPDAAQLLPVTDYSNTLVLTRGNLFLKPEYKHNLMARYHRFDQFNMSAITASLSAGYTNHYIAYSRTVQPDLVQQLELVNTPYQYSSQLSVSYSRPIQALGLNISAGLLESWGQSLSPVNKVNNRNNTWNHTLDISWSNINSDVWDIRWGGSIAITDARYSIYRDMNNRYYNYTGFVQLSYKPVEKWNFSVGGDITHYTAQSFDQPLTIPLVGAELTHYVLEGNRGALSLKVFDLLQKNQSLQRVSQGNYLLEQRANIIGRYLMLAFSYRLNKAGRPGAIQLQ